jgi:uncharacterized peroxidase-related enzyme
LSATKEVRDVFTLDYLEWTPWLEKATETELDGEQKQRVEEYVGKAQNSPYIAVLANDFPALVARASVHHHNFTNSDPEPTSYRELGATTASRINGCVFCASVHSRIFANLSKQREVTQRFLDDGIEADLPEKERAIVDLATKITLDPEGLSDADLAPLRALGFDDLGILDVLNYTAFFANANRLMLTLGEPVWVRAYSAQ